MEDIEYKVEMKQEEFSVKLVVQRVSEAKVEVDNKIVGKIGNGFLVLFGAGQG